jgi:hypothetical protein
VAAARGLAAASGIKIELVAKLGNERTHYFAIAREISRRNIND